MKVRGTAKLKLNLYDAMQYNNPESYGLRYEHARFARGLLINIKFKKDRDIFSKNITIPLVAQTLADSENSFYKRCDIKIVSTDWLKFVKDTIQKEIKFNYRNTYDKNQNDKSKLLLLNTISKFNKHGKFEFEFDIKDNYEEN
jgi:hypothetical protein